MLIQLPYIKIDEKTGIIALIGLMPFIMAIVLRELIIVALENFGIRIISRISERIILIAGSSEIIENWIIAVCFGIIFGLIIDKFMELGISRKLNYGKQ